MASADVLSLSSGLYAVPILIGSGLTLLACGVVLALYRRYEELRRHPASLVVVRVAFDFALALLLISEQVTRLSLASGSGGAGGGYDTTASCRTYAFWFQCVASARAHSGAAPGGGAPPVHVGSKMTSASPAAAAASRPSSHAPGSAARSNASSATCQPPARRAKARLRSASASRAAVPVVVA